MSQSQIICMSVHFADFVCHACLAEIYQTQKMLWFTMADLAAMNAWQHSAIELTWGPFQLLVTV